jgi:hypothetical protein
VDMFTGKTIEEARQEFQRISTDTDLSPTAEAVVKRPEVGNSLYREGCEWLEASDPSGRLGVAIVSSDVGHVIYFSETQKGASAPGHVSGFLISKTQMELLCSLTATIQEGDTSHSA